MRRYFLQVVAGIIIFLGIIFLLLPGETWNVFGVFLEGNGQIFVARLFAVANIGLGVILWSVSGITDVKYYRKILLSLVLFAVLEAAVGLHALARGMINSFSWFMLGLDVLLAAVSLYLMKENRRGGR